MSRAPAGERRADVGVSRLHQMARTAQDTVMPSFIPSDSWLPTGQSSW